MSIIEQAAATVKTAIARSVSHNEIVTLDYDWNVYSDLLGACDDNVEANGITEFWGTTESGSEWRVHMRAEVEVTQDAPEMSAEELALAKADYDVYS